MQIGATCWIQNRPYIYLRLASLALAFFCPIVVATQEEKMTIIYPRLPNYSIGFWPSLTWAASRGPEKTSPFARWTTAIRRSFERLVQDRNLSCGQVMSAHFEFFTNALFECRLIFSVSRKKEREQETRERNESNGCLYLTGKSESGSLSNRSINRKKERERETARKERRETELN